MQGGSLGSSQRALDITNERDALTLLQMVRHSALDAVSKDEVRDAVFAFRSSTSAEQLETLAMLVQPLKVTLVGAPADDVAPTHTDPVAAPNPTATPPAATPNKSGFSHGRAVPRFAPATAVTSTIASPTQTDAPKVADTPKPAPSPVPETAAEPAPASPTPTAPSGTNPKQRIEEIKHLVNAEVGNPVNLIDATNEVGREYMNALLEAMKATNGGGDTVTAMTRLEQAFVAVREALDTKPDSKRKTAAATPATTAAPTAPPTSTAASLTDTPAAGGYQAAATQATAANPVSVTDSAAAPSPTPEPASAATPAQAQTQTDTSAPASPAPATSRLTSLADTGVKTVAEQMPKPEVRPEPTDSLMSDTVTAGLGQLLNEWNLFKSGGLLGTGPKGVEHPLYKELKNTPMNLIIAGRFEGATPEVKQSIHDYMNGWRYEQGMTHDLKETFEHYLRRVVKTIIDKQPQSQ